MAPDHQVEKDTQEKFRFLLLNKKEIFLRKNWISPTVINSRLKIKKIKTKILMKTLMIETVQEIWALVKVYKKKPWIKVIDKTPFFCLKNSILMQLNLTGAWANKADMNIK